MCIISDTAEKMNVSKDFVFEMWGCFQANVTGTEINRAYTDWYYEGKLDPRVQSLCIDILTDRIPLVTLPQPKRKKAG